MRLSCQGADAKVIWTLRPQGTTPSSLQAKQNLRPFAHSSRTLSKQCCLTFVSGVSYKPIETYYRPPAKVEKLQKLKRRWSARQARVSTWFHLWKATWLNYTHLPSCHWRKRGRMRATTYQYFHQSGFGWQKTTMSRKGAATADDETNIDHESRPTNCCRMGNIKVIAQRVKLPVKEYVANEMATMFEDALETF